MDSLVPIVIVALFLAAIVLFAIGVAMAGFVQYRLSGLLSPGGRVALVLIVVGTGALLSIALTTRTLDDAQRDLSSFIAYEDLAKGFAASRWLNLLLVFTALVEAIRGHLAARMSPLADPARAVLWTLLAYYIGVFAVQTLASEHTALPYKDLYLPIVLAAIFYQRVERLDVVLAAARWVLFVLLAGSLAAAVVAPDFVLHRPEPGMIPGIDWRLYGLTAHANTIGPAALLAIVIEVYSPSRSRHVRVALLAAAGTVLLLAQSRTAWAAALAIVFLVFVPLALKPATVPGDRPVAFRRASITLVICMVIAIGLVVGMSAFGFGETLARKLELNTLNGRLVIWDITLQAWKENPLFGYGAEIWGSDRQWRFHMLHVGHAHNQIVQTLGESGLAGLALLCVYVGLLLRVALVRFGQSRGLVLALLIILFARFVTEAPMRAEGPLSWSAFLHILVVVVACHALRQPSKAVAPRFATVRDARVRAAANASKLVRFS